MSRENVHLLPLLGNCARAFDSRASARVHRAGYLQGMMQRDLPQKASELLHQSARAWTIQGWSTFHAASQARMQDMVQLQGRSGCGRCAASATHALTALPQPLPTARRRAAAAERLFGPKLAGSLPNPTLFGQASTPGAGPSP